MFSKNKHIFLLLGAFFVTVGNLVLFFSRWADSSLSEMAMFIKYADTTSLISGVVLGICAKILLSELFLRRWVSVLGLFAAAGIAAFTLTHIPSLIQLLSPNLSWLWPGFFFSLVFSSWKEPSLPAAPHSLVVTWMLFFAASFNFYLLFGPYSTHLPSFIQSRPRLPLDLTRFYYASTHPETAPALVLLRELFNSLGPGPTINAGALSSMLMVSLGIAFTATVARMVCGPLWGWGLLPLLWTDKWISSSAVIQERWRCHL